MGLTAVEFDSSVVVLLLINSVDIKLLSVINEHQGQLDKQIRKELIWKICVLRLSGTYILQLLFNTFALFSVKVSLLKDYNSRRHENVDNVISFQQLMTSIRTFSLLRDTFCVVARQSCLQLE